MSELISGEDEMKTAEFLNTKENYVLQILPEHAGDDPESGLVRVPDGADVATKYIHGKVENYNFWKDDGILWWNKTHGEWMELGCLDSHINHSGHSITWQRNTLQQKLNEVRQHLGITNNNTLSVMIGREKSYLRKLLKRKASSATLEKVIAKLDALKTDIYAASSDVDGVNVEYMTIDSHSKEMIKHGEIEEQARMIEARWSSCGQCVIKNTVIQQANDNAEIWLEKYSKLKAAFNWLAFFSISIFISWVILAYGVLNDLA